MATTERTADGAQARAKELHLRIGGAQLHLQQVQLRDDILIDEIHLDGKSLSYDAAPLPASENAVAENTGGQAGVGGKSSVQTNVRVEETNFTAMMSEPNLNRLLAANLPEGTPARHLRLLLLSGKARITGQFVKSVLSLPFTVEAVPVVDNGTRVRLDFTTAKLGVTLPGPVLDVIEQALSRSLSLDLSRLPFPVRLSDIKCEPGRLTVKGSARIAWPPVSAAPPPAPFSVLDRPLPEETLPAAIAAPVSPSSD